MKERPILFSAPMIRALLEGRKTQTRRICKPIMAWEKQDCREARFWNGGWHEFFVGSDIPYAELHCKFGRRGDRLWVRETWQSLGIHEALSPSEIPVGADVQYPATYDGWVSKHRPSIHMPRWASRITLEIESVRVERLQNISEDDAIAEGCSMSKGGMYCGSPHKAHGAPTQWNTAREAYYNLWEAINGQGSWAENPWVWVLCFKVVNP